MPSDEEKKKRKREKAEKLRKKQEEALKKAHEQEKKAEKDNADAKQKQDVPDEMSSKGYKLSSNELSSGQFSTVFKAKHNDEDIVARIIEKQGKDESFVNKLIPRFVRILRALNGRHPYIVNTLDVFETSKRVIILMCPTTKGSLYDFIDKQSNPTDENQCRNWAQQLISAVCYLHINGIVHRDLRTERILLDEKNSLKISGFTYSRLWMNVKKNTKELSNTCVGTGPYCAPETLSGESYDPRTADVWSFGVIVFFIWNKSYPFDYNLTHKLLAQHKSNEWMNRIRKESNDLFKEFFRKIFDVNHSQRPTIVDLLKDKWIDSKITVVFDESLKALDKKTPETNIPKENQTKEQAPGQTDSIQKGVNETKKLNGTGEHSDTQSSKGKDESSKGTEQSSDSKKISKQTNEKNGKEGIKNEKSDKNNSNVTKKEQNTEKHIKENDSKEDTDDSEDVTDVTDDDDENDSEKSEVKSDQKNKEQQNKSKTSDEKKEEKPTKIKSSPMSAKHEVCDPNVLKPDILEELKKEFLSIK